MIDIIRKAIAKGAKYYIRYTVTSPHGNRELFSYHFFNSEKKETFYHIVGFNHFTNLESPRIWSKELLKSNDYSSFIKLD